MEEGCTDTPRDHRGTWRPEGTCVCTVKQTVVPLLVSWHSLRIQAQHETIAFAFALLISREKTPEARPYSVALALRITPSISLQDRNKELWY